MTASPSSHRAGLVPGRWTKATRSDTASGCVEVKLDADGYHLRDTKDRGRGPVLTLAEPRWRALAAALLAAGPVDLPGLSVERRPDGSMTIGQPGRAPLGYTPFEVECFLDGLRRGEFEPLAALAR